MDFSHLLQSLEAVRYGMVVEGGGSVIYPLCVFRSWWDVVAFVPWAVANTLFSPFPSDWLIPGTMGIGARLFGAMDALLVYLLLPYVVIGIGRMIKRNCE